MADIKMRMGLEASVASVAKVPGQLLFTTDKGHIYLDTLDDTRVLLYGNDVNRIDELAQLIGTDSVPTQIKKAIDSLLDGSYDSPIKVVTGITGGDGILVDNQNPSKPVISIRWATDGDNPFHPDENGSMIFDQSVLTDYTINVTPVTDGDGTVKQYSITQLDKTFVIDVPNIQIKDMTVVDTSPDDTTGENGPYFKIVVDGGETGEDKTIYVKTSDIMEPIKTKDTDDIVMSINENNELSASLSEGLNKSIEKANTALQASDLNHPATAGECITGITVNSEGKVVFVTGKIGSGEGGVATLEWGTF